MIDVQRRTFLDLGDLRLISTRARSQSTPAQVGKVLLKGLAFVAANTATIVVTQSLTRRTLVEDLSHHPSLGYELFFSNLSNCIFLERVSQTPTFETEENQRPIVVDVDLTGHTHLVVCSVMIENGDRCLAPRNFTPNFSNQ